MTDKEVESVSHYVENYRFEFEDGRQYTPNEQDKALLEDAIESWNNRTPQPASVAQEETDEAFEERLLKQEEGENLRLLDYIADKIGLPHNEELTRDNFNEWLGIRDSAQGAVNRQTRCGECNLLASCDDPQCPNSAAQGSPQIEDLRKANQILHVLLTNQEWLLADAQKIIAEYQAGTIAGAKADVAAHGMPGERGQGVPAGLDEAIAEKLQHPVFKGLSWETYDAYLPLKFVGYCSVSDWYATTPSGKKIIVSAADKDGCITLASALTSTDGGGGA